MNEAKITEDQVREEHLDEVNVSLHWLYLGGVLVGSMVIMLAFIALRAEWTSRFARQ